jgi:hypothetical protein
VRNIGTPQKQLGSASVEFEVVCVCDALQILDDLKRFLLAGRITGDDEGRNLHPEQRIIDEGLPMGFS